MSKGNGEPVTTYPNEKFGIRASGRRLWQSAQCHAPMGTSSLEHSRFWEAESRSCSYECSCLVWNCMVHSVRPRIRSCVTLFHFSLPYPFPL